MIHQINIGQIIYAPISIIYSKIAVISTFNGFIHFYDLEAHDIIACLDLKLCGNLSRAIIFQQYKLDGGDVSGDRMLVVSNDGVMVMFESSLNDGLLLLSLCDVCRLPGESFSGAFFVEGTVIVGCRNNCLFNLNYNNC